MSSFEAFSGQKEGRDNPAAVAKAEIGSLPPGRYYIVDRKSGGRLGWLRDFWNRHYSTGREEWFALYRDDGVVDDATSIAGVSRGAFRLHPIGPRGLSEGCITMLHLTEFLRLHDALKAQKSLTTIPGGGMAYGTIDVH